MSVSRPQQPFISGQLFTQKHENRLSKESLAVFSLFISLRIVGDDDGGTLFTPEQYEAYKKKMFPLRLKNRLYVSYGVPGASSDCKLIGPDTQCFCTHRCGSVQHGDPRCSQHTPSPTQTHLCPGTSSTRPTLRRSLLSDPSPCHVGFQDATVRRTSMSLAFPPTLCVAGANTCRGSTARLTATRAKSVSSKPFIPRSVTSSHPDRQIPLLMFPSLTVQAFPALGSRAPSPAGVASRAPPTKPWCVDTLTSGTLCVK